MQRILCKASIYFSQKQELPSPSPALHMEEHLTVSPEKSPCCRAPTLRENPYYEAH